MRLKDTTYDFLKWLAIYFIPSLETFVLTVGTALKWAQTNVAGIIIGAVGALGTLYVLMKKKKQKNMMVK